jgi:hypothetical protein
MKKLKDLLKESQELDYRRMNVGEEDAQGMTKEEKRAFVEAVAAYRQLGEMISHKGNLAEIHDSIKGIVENANSITLKETGDWFDRVTVQRHMKSMNESFKVFSNTIKEVSTLQQRMESAYDEIGEVLGKYYEIKEGNEFGAERAKAIAAGEDSFEVDGKSFKVTGVDDEDKKNAEEFANESMKLTSLLKKEELKGNQDKIDFDDDGEIEASDLAALRAGKKKDESVNEGKKRFKTGYGIGKAKYVISHHNGVDKHDDGSDFYGISIYNNQKDFEKGKQDFLSKGYVAESVNEAFSDNKNLNYIMKGRKVTNVAYDSDFGFAVILDNGKYVLFNTHSARPGQSKDMEFESVNEGLSPEIAKHMSSIHKGFVSVTMDGVMVYETPAAAKKASDFLNSKQIAATANGKTLYIESVVKKSNINEVSATTLLKSVAKGESSRVQGVKISKAMAEHFLFWLRTSPYGKKYDSLPFHMLFTAAFNWGLHRYMDPALKGEYETLKKVAIEMEKKQREMKKQMANSIAPKRK